MAAILVADVAAMFDECLAHFEVSFPGRVEKCSLARNLVDMVDID